MSKDEVFARGYAVPVFDPGKDFRRWAYYDKEFRTPAQVIKIEEYGGWYVATVDDVRNNAL